MKDKNLNTSSLPSAGDGPPLFLLRGRNCSLGCDVSGGLGSGGIPAGLNIGRKGKHNAGALLITLSFPFGFGKALSRSDVPLPKDAWQLCGPTLGTRVRISPSWAVKHTG